MMRILRHPATNACCLSLFTAFYWAVFRIASPVIRAGGAAVSGASQSAIDFFWKGWCAFLAGGRHAGFAFAMLILTAAVVFLLALRRHPYDEYHTALLTQCLVVATVLTLAAIAVFFILILGDAAFFIAKFTLFVSIHWITIVTADLVYVILCRWG